MGEIILSPCGVMANLLDCDIVVSEFEFSRVITFAFDQIPLGNLLTL